MQAGSIKESVIVMRPMTEPANPSLVRAGRLLLAEVLVAVVLMVLLDALSAPSEWVVALLLVANIVPAWFLSCVAAAHGRSRLGYGLLASLGPPGALVAYLFLQGADLDSRMDRLSG